MKTHHRQTWEVLGQFGSLVGKTHILQHVLHLLLGLRNWTAFQQRVEEDMLRHSHTENKSWNGMQKNKQKIAQAVHFKQGLCLFVALYGDD